MAGEEPGYVPPGGHFRSLNVHVVKCTTYDGRTVYLKDPSQEQLTATWKRLMDGVDPEDVERAGKDGNRNKMELLKMTDQEFDDLPRSDLP